MTSPIEQDIKDALLATLRKVTGFRGMSENLVRVEAADSVVVIRIHDNQMFDSMAAIAGVLKLARGVCSLQGYWAEGIFICPPKTLAQELNKKAFVQVLRDEFSPSPPEHGRAG